MTIERTLGSALDRTATGANRWLGVELRHLATLQAVVSARSFRAAAVELGYVHSAVSQHVARLERAVGTQLVQRSRGSQPVEVTDAGRLLSARAERILVAVTVARTDLAAVAEGRTPPVRVGVSGAVPLGLVRALLSRASSAPVEVDQHTGEDALVTGIRSGEMRVCVGELALAHDHLAVERLLDIQWVLLVPASSSLRQRAPVRAELARLPLIGRSASPSYAAIERCLRAEHPGLNVVLRSDDPGRVRELVSAGAGVALVPDLGAPADEQVAAVSLDEPFPPLTLSLFWHRERSLGASDKQIVSALREIAAEHVIVSRAGRGP